MNIDGKKQQRKIGEFQGLIFLLEIFLFLFWGVPFQSSFGTEKLSFTSVLQLYLDGDMQSYSTEGD